MEDKISIKEILKYFWKKKILALIIIIVTFIVSFVGLSFYNDMGIVYTSNFRVSWTGYANDQYPDSSKFDYTDIVSKENLEKAKASDESFANINVEKMVDKGLIEITEVDVYVEKVVVSTHYTLNVSSTCFKSHEQASQFVLAAIEAHEDYVNQIISYMDVDNTLEYINDETEYEEMFTKLAIQKNNIYDLIAKLQKIRSLDFIYDEENGRSLRWIKKELQNLYDSYTYLQLPYRYRSDFLVRNSETFASIFEKQLLALAIQIDQKQAYLDNLKGQFGSSDTILGDAYLEEVMTLVSEIEELKIKENYLKTCINNPVEDAEYEVEVQKIYDKLEELTLEIKKAQIAVYENEVDHTFAGAKIVEKVEPIGTIMSGVIALALAIVVAAGVIVIMAMNNNIKQTKAKVIVETKE